MKCRIGNWERGGGGLTPVELPPAPPALDALPARISGLPPVATALDALTVATSGLPARLPWGVPFLLGALSLSFWRLRAPSLMSPPEPAPPSVSLPDPAPPGRFVETEGALEVLRERLGLAVGGRGGEPDREVGCDGPVVWTWGWDEDETGCCFLCFFREDSFPLASEARGEPGRLRLLEDEDGLRASLRCVWDWDEDVIGCCFLCFFRDDSFSLASEAGGEPARLRFLDEDCFKFSLCFEYRCDGEFVPFEELAEGV